MEVIRIRKDFSLIWQYVLVLTKREHQPKNNGVNSNIIMQKCDKLRLNIKCSWIHNLRIESPWLFRDVNAMGHIDGKVKVPVV